MRAIFDKRGWQVALERVSGAMADKNGTLPHEERICAELSLLSYEECSNRKQDRPLMYALVHDLQKVVD